MRENNLLTTNLLTFIDKILDDIYIVTFMTITFP